jgi:hypothetical protein
MQLEPFNELNRIRTEVLPEKMFLLLETVIIMIIIIIIIIIIIMFS